MSKKRLNQLDASFMYSQLLKEILLTIEFESKHIAEFIEYCRDLFVDNKTELSNVKKLEEKYDDNTPIWWYTCDSFLYSMLNRGLRQMDVNITIKLGFFIRDLHRDIENLHSQQFSDKNFDNIFTVYRGQGMSKTEFEQMSKTKGGLIAFSNFLSTSKKRNVSLRFSRNATNNPNLVGIIFVMEIDPAKSTTPFASISRVSYYGDREDEVLFAMHTVFRIVDIKPMDENQRLFQVNLMFTSNNDEDLLTLTKLIQNETKGLTGWDQLGELLLKMGQAEKAQQVYENILEQTTDESEKAPIYHQLGLAMKNQGEYEEALIFFEKALEIDKETLPSNHPDLAMSYDAIGNAHTDMNDYWTALSFYEEALEIRQQSLSTDHLDLASSYNNIGNVYNNVEEYSKALSYYMKDLAISEKSLPRYHPDLAASYNNIGSVYDGMGEYSKALEHYECAVNIAERSLPSNHRDLEDYRSNLDRIKKNCVK
jgi:tetratricopeptide (TPR) repeat protein